MSRFEDYINEAQKGDTALTTFAHEVATGIFLIAPNAKIETGADLYHYMVDRKLVVPAVVTTNRDVTETDMMSLPQARFLEPEVEISAKVVNDAKKLAAKIREKVGAPDSGKKVYWTGPTNDGSKYGAADITYISKGRVHPVSLKFGKGQLKNLGLTSLSKVLLKGIVKNVDDMNHIIYSNTRIWNELTKDWMQLLHQAVSKKKDVNDIVSHYQSLSYNQYQKQRVTQEEHDALADAGYIKPKDKMYLKQAMARIYSANKNIWKSWQDIRGKHFDKLFGGYFNNKEGQLNQNLIDLFKIQMSAGKGDMWYAAEGGKKVLFIPNEDTFDRVSEQLEFEYTSTSSKTGYTLVLNVTMGGKVVVKITINIRYAQGQMTGAVTTKSSMTGLKQEEWNKLFQL